MATKHVWLTLATLAVGAWGVAANAQSTVHLYIYDTHTGAVTQATGPMERDRTTRPSPTMARSWFTT